MGVLENALANKMRVANKFSQAAAKYDQAAKAQHDISQDALKLLAPNAHTLVDIGCGTGRVTRQLTKYSKQVYGVDFAIGMLKHAYSVAPGSLDVKGSHGGKVKWICGDAETLPLQDVSCDRVFSSMALQWCKDINGVSAELYRVLQTGGQGVLAIMCHGSLSQLDECWKELDEDRHLNQFTPADSWQLALEGAGFKVELKQQTYTTWHKNVRAVLRSIKDIGANVLLDVPNRPQLSKAKLQQLQGRYQTRFEHQTLLPLSYQVGFFVISKN